MIKIAVIDDHNLFRTSLVSFLSKQKGFHVLVEESKPAIFLNKLETAGVDIAIIDYFLHDTYGDELVKAVRQRGDNIKIIALSMSKDLHLISDLIEMGINSYISKYDDIEDLVSAIYAVYDNRIYRNSLFTEALYWKTSSESGKKVKERQNPDFSDREKTILQMLWEEKNNKDIAGTLFLGIRSIEKIRQTMKEKLGVKTTIGLLKYALKSNIIAGSSKDEPSLKRSIV
jgi:DNA-binding NarL/FixJ family response regulator